MASRWRSYLQSGAVLVAPPAQFELIGERNIVRQYRLGNEFIIDC